MESDSSYLWHVLKSCNKSKLLCSGAGKRHMESRSLWRLAKLAGRKLFKFQLLIMALSATLVLVFDFQSQLKWLILEMNCQIIVARIMKIISIILGKWIIMSRLVVIILSVHPLPPHLSFLFSSYLNLTLY